MDYEEMIEEDPKPPAETPELSGELEEIEPRAKSPWKAFILTGFLAGLIGAGGGGYGAYAALKKFSPAPAAQAKVDLTPIETKISRLSDRLAKAEAGARKTASRPSVKAKPVDLSAIEKRLKVLETAPSPEIDPAALSALQSAQKDGFEWPDVSKLEARIAELESVTDEPKEAAIPADLLERLTAMEGNIEAAQNAVSADGEASEIISGLEARLSALESRPVSPVIERVSILAFPKANLIDAVEATRAGGLFEKTLSRHIRVKGTNDPMTLIEGIELDLSEGRLAPAIEKFDRLPLPVRSVGQAWYESVKASL